MHQSIECKKDFKGGSDKGLTQDLSDREHGLTRSAILLFGSRDLPC